MSSGPCPREENLGVLVLPTPTCTPLPGQVEDPGILTPALLQPLLPQSAAWERTQVSWFLTHPLLGVLASCPPPPHG